MDLSCNENTLSNCNYHQFTKLTSVTHHFPKFWPCNLCQGWEVQSQGQGHKRKAKAKTGHSKGQGQQNWP